MGNIHNIHKYVIKTALIYTKNVFCEYKYGHIKTDNSKIRKYRKGEWNEVSRYYI